MSAMKDMILTDKSSLADAGAVNRTYTTMAHSEVALFASCVTCHRLECPVRGDATCAVEGDIYENTMALSEVYGLVDFLQLSMLRRLAFGLIKLWRAEKYLTDEGIVVDEPVELKDGELLTVKRENPAVPLMTKYDTLVLRYTQALGVLDTKVVEATSETPGGFVVDVLRKARGLKG